MWEPRRSMFVALFSMSETVSIAMSFSPLLLSAEASTCSTELAC
jgi:hypothetical protein